MFDNNFLFYLKINQNKLLNLNSPTNFYSIFNTNNQAQFFHHENLNSILITKIKSLLIKNLIILIIPMKIMRGTKKSRSEI